jgi:predicted phosphodiesterase
MPELAGILCIGDPHLASRTPGFRRDDYPRAVLRKLERSLDYAAEERLLPVILGDLFHWPRDNANWLIVELLELLDGSALAVAGNHDCNENTLSDDDTLSVLAAAGRIRLLDRTGPWRGMIGGRSVAVGGTSWGQPLPQSFDRLPGELVLWIAHHDVRFPGYEEAARFGCREIPGVDVLVNGHIHRPLEDVVCGGTTWINPGNIARVSRGEASRARKPAVLRIDIEPSAWSRRSIAVAHEPFEAVFHPDVADAAVPVSQSLFVRGLEQLESLKTGGAGLKEFLDRNLDQFDPDVAREIRVLSEEVLYGDQAV